MPIAFLAHLTGVPPFPATIGEVRWLSQVLWDELRSGVWYMEETK